MVLEPGVPGLRGQAAVGVVLVRGQQVVAGQQGRQPALVVVGPGLGVARRVGHAGLATVAVVAVAGGVAIGVGDGREVVAVVAVGGGGGLRGAVGQGVDQHLPGGVVGGVPLRAAGVRRQAPFGEPFGDGDDAARPGLAHWVSPYLTWPNDE